MVPSGKKREVVQFLLDMKKILSLKNSLQMANRQKNLQFLATFGYTIDDAKRILFSLGSKDYSSGPETDRNPNFPGDIWVFGCNVDEVELYIKIKLIAGECQQVVCISFHEAEWPLRYPFKG